MKYPPGTLVAEGINGAVVDARSQKPVPYAVVSVAWALQPKKGTPFSDKQPTRQGALQTYADQGGKFSVEGWQQRQPEASRGWEIVPGRDPVVRIYAQGYQRLAIDNLKEGKGRRPYNAPRAPVLKWIGQGKTQSIKPLPAGETALAQELRLWRQDLDEELQAVAIGRDQARAVSSQQKLLALFNDQCKKLSDELRQQICFPPGSEISKQSEEETQLRSKNLVYDKPNGEREVIPIVVGPPPGMGGASPVNGAAPPPTMRAPE